VDVDVRNQLGGSWVVMAGKKGIMDYGGVEEERADSRGI